MEQLRFLFTIAILLASVIITTVQDLFRGEVYKIIRNR